MPQVSISIANRNYELACGDGEEGRVQELAAYVDEKVGELRSLLADDSLYARDQKAFAALAAQLAAAQGELNGAEERWLELEMLRLELEG